MSYRRYRSHRHYQHRSPRRLRRTVRNTVQAAKFGAFVAKMPFRIAGEICKAYRKGGN